MARFASLTMLMVVAACATQNARPPQTTPHFALSPASLGRELSLQQQLRFSFPRGERSFDAYLESDAKEVRLAAMLSGQTALRIVWDGNNLQVRRADWLPEVVDAAAVLSDLQLVYWPLPALRAALPPGWRLEDSAEGRRLWQGDELVTDVHYSDRASEPRHIRIDHPGLHMRLDIESVSADAS
ncbi:MAG: DUF3261 domain-containing protein [Rhodocyclaceae bacterium]|jgi:hypothetical protein